jgi:hypothetical protein
MQQKSRRFEIEAHLDAGTVGEHELIGDRGRDEADGLGDIAGSRLATGRRLSANTG